MEESSEKRRQRLEAMRMQASSSTRTPPPPFQRPLPDLFNQPPAPLTGDDRSPAIPRFDYYTDPMSAFSSAKRRPPSHVPHQSPPVNYHSPPVNYHSPPVNFSPPVNYHSPPVRFHPHVPYRSPPVNFSPPFRGHSPNVRTPWRSPNPNPSPGSFRGHHSPYYNSGRGGRGGRDGGFGGRGRGYYGNGPEHFYIKAMVKDPWRKLKPIVGNILVPTAGADSWMPKTIAAEGTKRAKLGESSSGGGGSKKQGMSLAESLALAMEEAADDEHDLN